MAAKSYCTACQYEFSAAKARCPNCGRSEDIERPEGTEPAGASEPTGPSPGRWSTISIVVTAAILAPYMWLDQSRWHHDEWVTLVVGAAAVGVGEGVSWLVQRARRPRRG